MLRLALATFGLLFALGLAACDEPGDEAVPPQEPPQGVVPPAE